MMSQRNYPFEVALDGVAVREDFAESDDEDDDADYEAPSAHDRWSTPESKLPRNDVFLLEGQQLRYGSSAAWDARR
jgi:hypothetical protein